MKKVILLFAALLLAACAGGAHNAAQSRVYDFGQPAARVADAAWPRLALEVKAPHWLDSTAIAYRLAYDDPLGLRSYAGSRWAGAPAQLLGQRLQQQLGAQGASGNAAVDCLLRVELQEFSQVFAAAQQSRGVLHARLGLFDARRQLLAAHGIVIERPAPSADAHGGVVALVVASDELGQQLAAWLAAPASGASGCRSGRR